MAGATQRIANQGLYIGAGFTKDQGASLQLSGQLGMVVVQGGTATYQLVQITNATGAAAGAPCMWVDPTAYTVSCHVADTVRNLVAGVVLTGDTITANDYIWIQVGGKHAAVLDDGNSAQKGDVVYMSGTDGNAQKTTAGTAPLYVPLGVPTANTSAGKFPAFLFPPHNGW